MQTFLRLWLLEGGFYCLVFFSQSSCFFYLQSPISMHCGLFFVVFVGVFQNFLFLTEFLLV